MEGTAKLGSFRREEFLAKAETHLDLRLCKLWKLGRRRQTATFFEYLERGI